VLGVGGVEVVGGSEVLLIVHGRARAVRHRARRGGRHEGAGAAGGGGRLHDGGVNVQGLLHRLGEIGAGLGAD